MLGSSPPVRTVAPALLACAWLLGSACDGGRHARSSGGSPRASDRDAAIAGDALPRADAALLDAALDAEPEAHDAGSDPRDASAPDAPGGRDAAANPDAAPPPPPGMVSVLTSGCSADFGGELVVSYNGSIAVGSLRGATLAASLQFDLRGQSGLINLSTQHRVQTGLVVNLVTWSTWTNIAQDPEVYTGNAPDPITGSLLVRAYDPSQGVMDIELQGVTIQNVSDLSFCTLDGRVLTTRLGR